MTQGRYEGIARTVQCTCEHEEGEKNSAKGSVSRYQRARGESDVKGDVSGGSHEDDGEELKRTVPRADQRRGNGRGSHGR